MKEERKTLTISSLVGIYGLQKAIQDLLFDYPGYAIERFSVFDNSDKIETLLSITIYKPTILL